MDPSKPIVDIIWNTTTICPWNCKICCVDAAHVTGEKNHVSINSRGLKIVERIAVEFGTNKFDVALKHLQKVGRELNWSQKLAVLDHLAGEPVRIDISGGDALVVKEGHDLLREVAARFGRESVTLTVTGAGLRKRDVTQVASLISEFNFTFDAGASHDVQVRPSGYAKSNLLLGRQMAARGVPVRAELPLTKFITNQHALERIYVQLAESGIQRLLVMRLFAVGRGAMNRSAVPSRDEYRYAIDTLFELERRYAGPAIGLQCALRHLMPRSGDGSRNPCDFVRESFGLMANGTLLASPWAIGPTGEPLHPAFVLGNLAKTPFAELRNGTVALDLARRADKNFGHCKIFAFQHSKREDPVERMLDPADPLYMSDPQSAMETRRKPIFWARAEMAQQESQRPQTEGDRDD